MSAWVLSFLFGGLGADWDLACSMVLSALLRTDLFYFLTFLSASSLPLFNKERSKGNYLHLYVALYLLLLLHQILLLLLLFLLLLKLLFLLWLLLFLVLLLLLLLPRLLPPTLLQLCLLSLLFLPLWDILLGRVAAFCSFLVTFYHSLWAWSDLSGLTSSSKVAGCCVPGSCLGTLTGGPWRHRTSSGVDGPPQF